MEAEEVEHKKEVLKLKLEVLVISVLSGGAHRIYRNYGNHSGTGRGRKAGSDGVCAYNQLHGGEWKTGVDQGTDGRNVVRFCVV